MNRFLFINIIITILSLHAVKAQTANNQTDSLFNILNKTKDKKLQADLLNEIGNQYSDINPDSAIVYYEKSKQYAENTSYKECIAAATFNCGKQYYVKHDLFKASEYLESATSIYRSLNDKAHEAEVLDFLGTINSNAGLYNYPKALACYNSAYLIWKELRDSGAMANNLIQNAILHHFMLDRPTAFKYFNEAAAIVEARKDSSGMMDVYVEMARVYIWAKDYEKSEQFILKAWNIAEKVKDENQINLCTFLRGLNALRQKQFSNAIPFLEKAVHNLNPNVNDHNLTIFSSFLSEAYVGNKNYTEALKYSLKALAVGKALNDLSALSLAWQDISSIYEGQNKHALALDAYKKFKLYSDSISNSDKTKEIARKETQFVFQQKEAAAKLEQDKKDALAIKELQRQKMMRNSFIVGFSFMLLFAGVFFTQRNKIKKGKAKSDELLLNILPEEVAEELKIKGSTDAKHFDEVTVLFTDFKNFTLMSEKLSPQELVNEINYCYSAFDIIVTRQGIEKIKTIGDSYMCAGGLPLPNTTNAEDIVKAALEIRDFILEEKRKREANNSPFFEVRIGCHTGPVVAGIVGIKKFAYDIWGDTVNIASRMESSGMPGKVNISGTTYELVKDKFHCIYRGKIEAKNKGEIDMYFVEENNV